jgi:hypothetical protein
MVKVKIALPPNDPSSAEAEWVWADPEGNNTFVIRNIPTFATGLSYGDTVRARIEHDIPVFEEVVGRGGHSTYRIYSKSDRRSPEVMTVLQALATLRCDTEGATDKIVGVDVLPEADIYAVYKILEDAEEAGILEFEEGHCGHSLRSTQ